jgi:hypothetical protein
VTFFNVSATSGTNLVERWDGDPPTGIAVTLSFAEPFKNVDGTYDVPEEEKFTRTIAIDRTRKIQFDIAGGQAGIGQVETKGKDASGGTSLPTKTAKPDEKRK